VPIGPWHAPRADPLAVIGAAPATSIVRSTQAVPLTGTARICLMTVRKARWAEGTHGAP
jgi:hypothetical protein